jgi:hypothetical protein
VFRTIIGVGTGSTTGHRHGLAPAAAYLWRKSRSKRFTALGEVVNSSFHLCSNLSALIGVAMSLYVSAVSCHVMFETLTAANMDTDLKRDGDVPSS